MLMLIFCHVSTDLFLILSEYVKFRVHYFDFSYFKNKHICKQYIHSFSVFNASKKRENVIHLSYYIVVYATIRNLEYSRNDDTISYIFNALIFISFEHFASHLKY